jgi:hypothetical protein
MPVNKIIYTMKSNKTRQTIYSLIVLSLISVIYIGFQNETHIKSKIVIESKQSAPLSIPIPDVELISNILKTFRRVIPTI